MYVYFNVSNMILIQWNRETAGSMCSTSDWDGNTRTHTNTHIENNLWNGPQHFSSTPFLVWVTVELLFFFFNIDLFHTCHVVICPVAKGLNSCQRGKGVGELVFLVWFSVRLKVPWCTTTGPGSNGCFMFPQLFFVRLIYLTTCLI